MKFLSLSRFSCVAVIALLIGAGCGKQPEPTVKGLVTYDGTPIEKGEIIFQPVAGEGKVVAGQIVNGQYNLSCSLGEMKVEITGTREEGVAKDGLPNFVSFVPKKYNSDSNLTEKIESTGENIIDFSLEK